MARTPVVGAPVVRNTSLCGGSMSPCVSMWLRCTSKVRRPAGFSLSSLNIKILCGPPFAACYMIVLLTTSISCSFDNCSLTSSCPLYMSDYVSRFTELIDQIAAYSNSTNPLYYTIYVFH